MSVEIDCYSNRETIYSTKQSILEKVINSTKVLVLEKGCCLVKVLIC